MKTYLIILSVVILAMQLIRPDRTNPTTDKALEIQTDPKVMKILKRSCYDCHSNETKWPVYSAIAPFSWTVTRHVDIGRKVLNYSTWNDLDNNTKIKKLQRTIQTIGTGVMPLPSYIWIHKDAKLRKADRELLHQWAKEELDKLGVKVF